MMRSATIGAFGLAASLAFTPSSAVAVDDLIAARQLSGTKIGFLVKDPYTFATLTVSGPNELNASAFSKSGAVAIDLRQLGDIEDGAYVYQLTAASGARFKTRLGLDDGRGRAGAEQPAGVAINGTFHVKDGKIIAADDSAPPSKNDRDAR